MVMRRGFLGGLAGSGIAGTVTDATTQNRPALVVKIDNHPEARPQTGLNQADVVYEEEVEGITRFFAVFQSATDAAILLSQTLVVPWLLRKGSLTHLFGMTPLVLSLCCGFSASFPHPA